MYEEGILPVYKSFNEASVQPSISEVASGASQGEGSAIFRILELGCGDGSLWIENLSVLPENIHITLSDISEGMIRDVRRRLPSEENRFSFETFDCHDIPHEDESFDLVIANHLLFYCDDIHKVCKEISRILKPGGISLCSTYGDHHMKEITSLVQEFDQRIVLAAENLYDRFGLDNGAALLAEHFTDVDLLRYEDAIEIHKAEPLVEYILSCHGNQNQYILDRYHEFRQFVEKKVQKKYRITKDAGIFVCEK
jgi:SAM-dependent methyltransferase